MQAPSEELQRTEGYPGGLHEPAIRWIAPVSKPSASQQSFNKEATHLITACNVVVVGAVTDEEEEEDEEEEKNLCALPDGVYGCNGLDGAAQV